MQNSRHYRLFEIFSWSQKDTIEIFPFITIVGETCAFWYLCVNFFSSLVAAFVVAVARCGFFEIMTKPQKWQTNIHTFRWLRFTCKKKREENNNQTFDVGICEMRSKAYNSSGRVQHWWFLNIWQQTLLLCAFKKNQFFYLTLPPCCWNDNFLVISFLYREFMLKWSTITHTACFIHTLSFGCLLSFAGKIHREQKKRRSMQIKCYIRPSESINWPRVERLMEEKGAPISERNKREKKKITEPTEKLWQKENIWMIRFQIG